jgi:hypothetical protein
MGSLERKGKAFPIHPVSPNPAIHGNHAERRWLTMSPGKISTISAMKQLLTDDTS